MRERKICDGERGILKESSSTQNEQRTANSRAAYTLNKHCLGAGCEGKKVYLLQFSGKYIANVVFVFFFRDGMW